MIFLGIDAKHVFIALIGIVHIYKDNGAALYHPMLGHHDMVGLRQCISTVVPAKSNSDAVFCLQSCQGLIIDRSPVY